MQARDSSEAMLRLKSPSPVTAIRPIASSVGGPMANSRLNLILREKYGLVYSVDASYGLYTDAGTATIYFGCEKANVQKCLTLIERELRSLREETLSPRALNSAKKQLLGQMAIAADNGEVAADNGEAQVLSMGKSLMTYGRVISNKETAELISGITAEEIRDTAADIFNPENISRLLYI